MLENRIATLKGMSAIVPSRSETHELASQYYLHVTRDFFTIPSKLNMEHSRKLNGIKRLITLTSDLGQMKALQNILNDARRHAITYWTETTPTVYDKASMFSSFVGRDVTDAYKIAELNFKLGDPAIEELSLKIFNTSEVPKDVSSATRKLNQIAHEYADVR